MPGPSGGTPYSGDHLQALCRQIARTRLREGRTGPMQPADVDRAIEQYLDLPKLLALAQYANVRVKISGACTMSYQPFPYDDIWEPVLRIIDAFGLDRCMWGTDWTRAIGMLTYEQGVTPFRATKRLSESDKAALMGGTLQKVYKW